MGVPKSLPFYSHKLTTGKRIISANARLGQIRWLQKFFVAGRLMGDCTWLVRANVYGRAYLKDDLL